jgi:hypothetical protein
VIPFRPPSLSKAYDEFVSIDPVFVRPPDPPSDDASEEDLAAYKTALEEYASKLRVARQTGDWSGMLAPGRSLADATKFTLLPVDFNTWRELVDRATQREGTAGRIGGAQLRALLVRLAVKAITGFETKIERTEDPAWGYVMAQPDVVNILDNVHPSIVGELGTRIAERLRGVDPLSLRG